MPTNWPTTTNWPNGTSWPAGTSFPSAVTLASILAGVPLAWSFDAGAAGTGTTPTGSGNTLTSPTILSVMKDQSGARDFTTPGGGLLYSATGGPAGKSLAQSLNASGTYLRNVYAAPAPGTTPSCYYLLLRPDVWALNGAIVSASAALQIAGSSAGKYTARNGVASAEVAAAAGTYIRVSARFGNAVTDFLRMGANSTTGTALGNSAGGANCFLGVDAAFSYQTVLAGFMTLGDLTDSQFTELDAYYFGRYPGVQF